MGQRFGRAGIVFGLLVVAAVVVVVWVLPWYVRRECIEDAARHGIALEIDGVSVGIDGFRLLGVRATSRDLPGATAQAPEVEVPTSGFRPQKMIVRRAELAMNGPWSGAEPVLAKWRAPAGGDQGDFLTPATLIVDESRLVWLSPVGGDERVEAAGIHAELSGRDAASELHTRADKVTVALPRGTFGPWRLDIDRTPATWRVRVALDPAAPDACTVLVVGDGARATSVDVAVPRSPFGRIGVPAELLGLRGKGLQVALEAHYAALGPQRADATAKGGLYGIDAGLPMPLDVVWEVAATGDPRSGLDLKDGRLAAGPLSGTLGGTLQTFDDGLRVDLAWSAGPVPCSAFDAPLEQGQFDIGYQLRKLAEATGITKVSGEVRARGALALDTRQLAATRLDFQPDVQCQVALFSP